MLSGEEKKDKSTGEQEEKAVVGKPRVFSHFFPVVDEQHPIPKLELLDALVGIGKSKNVTFERTVFVGVQHILETTASLFKALIQLGAQPQRMFFSGKCYSTSSTVASSVKKLGVRLMPDYFPTFPGQYQTACREGIRDMWKQVEEYLRTHDGDFTILIVDDGGRCFEEMPAHLRFKYKVAGTEQTRGGLYSPTLKVLPFPLVEVATSAAKRYLESQFIAQAIIDRLKDFILSNSLSKETVFGVVGNGAIGDAIAMYLQDHGFNTLIYDEAESAFQQSGAEENCFRCETIESLMENADCIFGCTGCDITEKFDVIQSARRQKIIINATSEDREVLKLLKMLASLNVRLFSPFDDIVFETDNGAKIIIPNGGFPFNFNRKPWNVPAHDIELTQGLMLISCMQGELCATKPVGGVLSGEERRMLSPLLQKFAVEFWQKRYANNRYPEELLHKNFQSVEWIKSQSGEGRCDSISETLFSNVALEQSTEHVSTNGFSTRKR